ncbi:DUF998 domain-containing protein [Microbacterium sp. NPDC089189]|uniref:DUF998 domain-containing protein n=1 Tax=Microbacterium sp. NPDC089189 TaxID=3154972 RepID=UPI00342D52B3
MNVLWAVIILAATIAAFAALLTAHLVPSGLSPLRDPVSAYGISRYAGLYRAQTLATAVAAAAGAIALALLIGAAATPAVISLAVLALARGVISWVPMDAPGETRSGTGRAHNLLAFAAFAAASVSGFMVGIAFGATTAFAAFAPTATVFGWIATIASAVTLLAAVVRPLSAIFGLAERVIYIGMLGLLVTVGVAFALV